MNVNQPFCGSDNSSSSSSSPPFSGSSQERLFGASLILYQSTQRCEKLSVLGCRRIFFMVDS